MPMSKDVKIQIPAPNIQAMKVKINGLTPIIFNQFPHKAVMQIFNKQSGILGPKKREARDPEQEYLDSFYKDSEGQICMPALNIKQAIVDAARNIEGVTMALLKGSVFVVGDKDGLIPVLVGGKPFVISKKPHLLNGEAPATGVIGYDTNNKMVTMRRDVVRLGGIDKPADLRYRGQADSWSMEFLIKFNADVLAPEWVLNLLNTAGFSCGLGEWRPERNGASGTFEVQTN